MKTLNHSNQAYPWIVLSHIPGLGFATIQSIIDKSVVLAELFNLSLAELKHLGLADKTCQAITNPPWQSIEETLTWAERPGNHLITLSDSNYPTLLKKIASPPLMLYAQGEISLLEKPQIAIVGTRHPSYHGKQTAHQFSANLSQNGLIVTSGLADGIDSHAHLGALSVNHPTIAVMGTGLNQIYPAKNRDLAVKIRENGVILSEFHPATGVRPYHFPQRNRIISGLSLGTLVVEAAKQSGSLITARCALEQNREVFAIPGSIHHPQSKGCHLLIKQGAKLVESSQDILEELQISNTHPMISTAQVAKPTLSKPEKTVYDLINYDEIDVESLILLSQQNPQMVNETLQSLLLRDLIIESRNGYIRK